MSSVALTALLRAKPSGAFWARPWLEEVLARHWPGYGHGGDHAWSVGTVLGNETLVQSRPIVRHPDGRFLDDLLRTPAPCTIAGYTWDRDGSAGASSGVGVMRFQRWIGITAEQTLAEETRERTTRRLSQELPGFLQRARVNNTDSELAFLAFLAALHQRGGLGSTYADAEEVRAALGMVNEEISDPLSMFVYDGKTLGVIHRSGTLLTFDPPPPPAHKRRRRSSDEEPRRAHANLLVLLPGPPPPTPIAGAERIAEGVFSMAPARPRAVVRE